ncbi:MAG: glycerate kinase [Propionibacteriaceae bacterium]
MRIVVATDSVGSLTSAQAGAAVASGWPAEDTTVVPLGESGAGAIQALADAVGGVVAPGVVGDRLSAVLASADLAAVGLGPPDATDGPLPYGVTSRPLGEALAELLRAHPAPRVVIDLAGLDTHDGGAGLLAALGVTAEVRLDLGVAGLTGLSRLDLAPAFDLLRGAELVGLVPSAERDRPLLGLRGITAARGRAGRVGGAQVGTDADRLLATDGVLARLADLAGVGDQPGLGACGGTALAVRALGGRLVTGPELGAELTGLADTVARADLVVTGCSVFDFAHRGGGVVAEVARIAERALRPCVVVAGEVRIGGREMRTMGIEAAYAVREPVLDDVPSRADVDGGDLYRLGARVARTWRW